MQKRRGKKDKPWNAKTKGGKDKPWNAKTKREKRQTLKYKNEEGKKINPERSWTKKVCGKSNTAKEKSSPTQAPRDPNVAKTVCSRPEPLPTMTRRAPKHGHKKCQPKYKRQKERKGELTRAKQFVRNFSSHQLTIPEIEVLAKGLKFIPYPGQPQKQALIAIKPERNGQKNELQNQIRGWRYPLYTNTGFDPGRVDPTIDAYLDETRINLEEMNIPQASSQQLTNEERKALVNLKNLDHIVILKADKNSTIVVMDKDDYIKEGLRQLASNPLHWSHRHSRPNRAGKPAYENDRRSARSEPNRQNNHRFLSQTAKQNSWREMYLLPKVHKLSSEKIIQAETHSFKSLNKTLPGRPIIAQCGSPTYFIGKLIDILLLPIVKRQNTYIRDTPHFIRMIESLQASPNCTLVAYDCTSVYEFKYGVKLTKVSRL